MLESDEKRQFIDGRIADVKKDLEGAEETLKMFRERNRQIFGSPALLLEQERLVREVEVQKNIFITLKQQLEMAKIEEVQEASMVQVLDPPEAPLYKSKPKRKSTVLLAGILGLGLGIVFAFLLEYSESGNSENNDKFKKVRTTFRYNLWELLPFKKDMCN